MKKIFLALILVSILAVVYIQTKTLWQTNSVITTPKQNNTSVSPGAIQPLVPKNSGLLIIPDISKKPVLTDTMSVKYLIEHRSALNEKTVKVRGVVVANLTDNSRCRPDITEMLCPQPIIYIADSASADRPADYDLRVVLGEEDKSYQLGQSVEIKGIVEGNTESVLLIKAY